MSNDVQKQVFESLLLKVGAGAAAFYLDSCTLRRLGARLLSTRMLVAHTLREVRALIEARLTSEGVEDAARPGALQRLRKQLHKLAHRRWLELPEPIDDAFRAAAADVDETLALLLREMNAPEVDDPAASFLARFGQPEGAVRGVSIWEEDVRLLNKFADHIAPGPTAYLHDAIQLLDDRFAFLLTRSHLIAHSLRETESGLRDLFLPSEFESKDDGEENNHQQEVESILAAYGISRSEPVAIAWESITSVAADRNLAARAHASEIEQARSLDDEARGVFRSVIDVFTALLARFEHEFVKYIRRMDEMLASPTVTKTEFLSELPQTEAIYLYFFRRLDNPEWAVALANTNVLRHTPEPHRRGDHVELPSWPQGEYLRRALEKKPGLAPLIADLMDLAVSSTNPRVHEEIVKTASLLPNDLRRTLVGREMRWMEKEPFIWFLHAEAASSLAVKLAEAREHGAVEALVRILVRFDVESENGQEVIRLRTDRLALENVLEDVIPQLAASCGTSILAAVGDALDTLRTTRHPDLTPPVDYSFAWRPAIEDHEENHAGNLEDALVDALRDGAANILAADRSRFREVVEFFLERRWNIERRVALHLLAEGQDAVLAGEIASRVDLLDSEDCWHEMARVLGSHWSNFSEAARATVISFIGGLARESKDAGTHAGDTHAADRARQFRHLARLPSRCPPRLQISWLRGRTSSGCLRIQT